MYCYVMCNIQIIGCLHSWEPPMHVCVVDEWCFVCTEILARIDKVSDQAPARIGKVSDQAYINCM